jgi:hypothetical protein
LFPGVIGREEKHEATSVDWDSIFRDLTCARICKAPGRLLPNAGWRLISRRAIHNNMDGAGNVRFHAIARRFAAVGARLRLRLLPDRGDAAKSGAP